MVAMSLEPIFTNHALSSQSYKIIIRLREWVLFITQANVGAVLVLRTYALYGRSIRMLTFLLGSAAVLISITCYMPLGRKRESAATGVPGCHLDIPPETAIRLAGAWECLLAFDMIVFCLTLYKMWKTRRGHALGRISIPLVSLIFRDGANYFVVMALANLANIFTFYFCGPLLAGSLSAFASNISVSMVSRLMLNLHESADMGILTTGGTSNSRQRSTYTAELDSLHTRDLSLGRATGDFDLESDVR